MEGASGSLERSARNTFGSLALDRVPRRRRDPAWVERQLSDPATRFLPIWDSHVFVTPEARPSLGWMTAAEARPHIQKAESVVLLGQDGRHTYVAIAIADDGRPPADLAAQGSFCSLRTAAGLVEEESAGLLAYAKAMVEYHRGHRFCGACGTLTKSVEGGHLRVCTNPHCGQQDFPRIDPAIIVVVSSGERCLLGRQVAWSENLYSVIAGFVEPGESLEATVVREVREETGVRVTNVQYHSSQPWPFPRSLMIGFSARADSTRICLHDGELEKARWFSRDEIAREVREGRLQLSSPISISYRLIETWFNSAGPKTLTEVLRSM